MGTLSEKGEKLIKQHDLCFCEEIIEENVVSKPNFEENIVSKLTSIPTDIDTIYTKVSNNYTKDEFDIGITKLKSVGIILENPSGYISLLK